VNYCASRGEEIEKIALEFALSNKDVDSTLVGTASIEEVENNIQCAEQFFKNGPSHPELLAEIQAILKPIQNRAWSSGLPENNDMNEIVEECK
jgi:L-galactose dehydrogenase